MWLWSVQGSSQGLAWTPQWWFAALPSVGLIRYGRRTTSSRLCWEILDVTADVLFLIAQQMAGLVTDYMESYGTRFMWRCVPKRVDKLPSGALQVTWTNGETGNEHSEAYDTVLWAVGESQAWNNTINTLVNLMLQTETQYCWKKQTTGGLSATINLSVIPNRVQCQQITGIKAENKVIKCEQGGVQGKR